MVGVVDITTSPELSIATHKETDGHDIPVNRPTPVMFSEVTLGEVALGFSQYALRPPTAMQKVVEGHETPGNGNPDVTFC